MASNGNGNGNGSRPIATLLSDAATQVTELARQEMELARVDLRHDVAAASVTAAGFGVAGAAALVGVVFVCLAAMFALGEWLPMWASALIVGGVVLGGAGVCALVARRAMRRVQPPRRTLRTLKEDATCLRRPSS
jgi:hypothetical protein